MTEINIMVILPFVFIIAVWIYAYRKGVRWLCPNCGQRQTGWSTQCPRCGVVFKDWKE
ncbi:MAG: hypothetical protein OXU23_03030 [Candidatus Poribacteria bacterium]|nr:hypothetical protein [Candidatus Poribacteria bacterium]